jgi:hypothetical protein
LHYIRLRNTKIEEGERAGERNRTDKRAKVGIMDEEKKRNVGEVRETEKL